MVKFGGDLSGLSTALRGVKGMVQSAGDSIKDGIKGMFAGFSAGAIIAGVVEQIHGLMEEVKNIRRISESTGLNTGIVQDLMNLGKEAGISSEKLEKMLDSFSRGLAPGQDAETALYQLADRLRDIPDPAERSRVAFEALGAAGQKLIPILKEGADGVRKLAEEWGRLDDAEINELEHADKVIDKMQNKLKVLLAHDIEGGTNAVKAFEKMPMWKKILGGPLAAVIDAYKNRNDISDENPDTQTTAALPTPNDLKKAQRAAVVKALNDLHEKENYVEAKPEEKALMLTRKILAARREIESESPKSEKQIQDIAANILDLENQRKNIQKEMARENEKSRKAELEHAEKLLKLELNRKEEKMKGMLSELKSDSPTLLQLAQSGHMFFQGNRWQMSEGPFAAIAQRILNLRADVGDAVTWNDTGRRDYDMGQIEKLKQALPFGMDGSQAEANGMFKSMTDDLSKMETHIQNISDQISKLVPSTE